MESTEVVTHWENIFKRIDYRQTKPNKGIEKPKSQLLDKNLALPRTHYFYIDVDHY